MDGQLGMDTMIHNHLMSTVMVSIYMYLQLATNARCSVIIFTVKKYQKQVIQLQQELEKKWEMLYVKDMIISDLEQENSQMQNKRETIIVNSAVQCVLKVI